MTVQQPVIDHPMTRSEDRVTVVQAACAVPYRLREGRMEFCIVSPPGTTLWEFPYARIRPKELASKAAVRCAEKKSGAVCRRQSRKPLDRFSTVHKKRAIVFVAYLLNMKAEPDAGTGRRSRWCYAEEARARIRRKPMRRLIDLALRQL
jgi:hypothetical protein